LIVVTAKSEAFLGARKELILNVYTSKQSYKLAGDCERVRVLFSTSAFEYFVQSFLAAAFDKGLASATGHKRQVQALSATVDRGEAGARLGATGGRSGPGAFDNDMISGQSPYMPEQRTWLVRRARGSAMCCLSQTRPVATVSA